MATKKIPAGTLEICTDHTGKMEGINSLSTSVKLNPNCQKNQKIRGTICAKCYAENMTDMYAGLSERLVRNTEILTKPLTPEQIPVITDEIFRFESFGDLNNEIQLDNYVRIARANPGTRFTLWTKMYLVAYHYFSEHDVPENFTLILSSLMINTKLNLDSFKKLGKFKKGQLKVFTVYDLKYIKKHWEELNINCGSRLCAGCRQCYDKNDVEEINEILKSDQPAALKFLGTKKDPGYVSKLLMDAFLED